MVQYRRTATAGNGGGCQALQEHVVHEYLVALRHKHRRFIPVCRVNKRDTIGGNQKLTQFAFLCILHAEANTRDIMFAVFGLLNFDAPHGIPFIVSVLPLFRKLIQSAGVILRQINFFQQLLAEMGFG